MHLPAVKLFLEVAEAGSLNKVAARRQTAQSHVSRQISEFESGFDAPLFRRTGRGVVLTELGERVAARLRPWVQETEQLAADFRAECGRITGQVRLGVIPSAAHPLATHLFAVLQTQHPGITLDIAEAQGTDLDAMLDAGLVDLAVLFRFSKPGGGDEKLLGVAHTYLVSAAGDLLTREATLPFARLEGLRLVLPRRPSHWRNALEDTARGLGFRLSAAAEADSLTVQKELVAQQPGLYSVLGPYAIAAELRAGRLQASKLVRPDLVRHVALALPKQGKSSPASRIVAKAIEDLLASWAHQLSGPV